MEKGDLKFPIPPLLQYAMEYVHFSSDMNTSKWLNTSLSGIMNGGIYDQLEGGFARYSTDPKWKVPHFEKMLYDNAQLISIYANAYKSNPEPDYKQIIEQTVQFLKQNLVRKKAIIILLLMQIQMERKVNIMFGPTQKFNKLFQMKRFVPFLKIYIIYQNLEIGSMEKMCFLKLNGLQI
ncbi:MAG: thioredoxin domain-containing protein [Saprospiraceae bacterium]|nr:thioredoxin domain-containing protein [Saprospiraceae bacterium]